MEAIVADNRPVKVLLTHRGAARAKYGSYGWSVIRQAITNLMAADAGRGLNTRFLALDSASDAHKVGAAPVDAVGDAQAIKAFVDAVYTSLEPAYIVLVGGPDLVATVPMRNPLWDGTPEGDPSPVIPSDLPYACSAPYSTSVSDFAGATRVVGRVPDLTGVDDHGVLVDLLHAAAGATPLAAPTAAFALSTRSWQASTRQSVSALPLPSIAVRTCPAEGPGWTRTDFAPPVHFVNCHGGEFDPRWYGELRSGQATLPTAVDGPTLPGLIAPGTVVSAECCFGTAHWPPAGAGGARSVALTYLASGASGFFGSATTAYGPSYGNEYADVIAQVFLAEVLAGASLGRAALVARQRYVQSEGFLDPTSLTTLAQFTLLGDPSVQAFHEPGGVAPKAVAHAKAIPNPRAKAGAKSSTAGIMARRRQLVAVGDALQVSTEVSSDQPTGRPGISERRFEQLARHHPRGRLRTFESRAGDARRGTTAHLAFVPAGKRRQLVIVRETPGSEPVVRVVHAKCR